jgi:adenylyl-sulfate kinase
MTPNIITWHNHHVRKKEHSKIKNQKPCILWFTGLSASGKSTLANAVETRLNNLSKHTYLLDGDNVRHRLNKDLGFSDKDRAENIRRIGEVCYLFVDAGIIVLTAFISPFAKDRDSVRNLVAPNEFIEIFMDTPLEVCEKRDPKGYYKKARAGIIKNYTGITSSYEAPINSEIQIKTQEMNLEESVNKIMIFLETNGYLCFKNEL